MADNHKILKDQTGQQIVQTLREINKTLGGNGGIVYGFRINSTESDPSAAVTYIADAVGMVPASMDFTNGEFSWGSWENAFFMPRPCMLRNDGFVAYYLDEYDYTKQADGISASDVANASFAGNAMMEWGRDGKIIWYKVVPEQSGNGCAVYIADYKADAGFQCWPFVVNGKTNLHFYTSIYNGTVVSDGTNPVLRSLSGMAWRTYGCAKKDVTTERWIARNNGTGWDTEVYADVILINLLLTLMGKSLDTQAVFGQGLNASGSEAVNNGFTTGVHDKKGLFYGTNSGAAATYTNAVKVFGMENWYGFLWRRFAGLVNVNGTMRYKLTRGTDDGTTVSDYVSSATATDYDGYLTGDTLPAASGTYIKYNKWNADGASMPVNASGDSAHYYCDGFWANNNQVDYASRGGDSGRGAHVGAWYLTLNDIASYTAWFIGASLSYKSQS